MKTAKEFFEERHYQGYSQHELDHYSFRLDTLHKTMIEFAKLHVKAALKAAAKKAEIKTIDEGLGEYDIVNEKSIRNAYPDKRIK